MATSSPKNKTLLTAATMVVVFGCLFGLLAYLNKASTGPPKPVEVLPPNVPKLDIAQIQKDWPQVAPLASPVRGRPDTPYSLYEFGDFQCPLCAKSRTVLEALVQRDADKVNLRFIHRPFPTDQSGAPMHLYAMAAAQASEAAALQGKFWEMYDTLYAHQEDLEPGFYDDYAGLIGLNKAKFHADKNAPAIQTRVEKSKEWCDNLKIVSTPTILIRDNKTGQFTVANSKADIDALVAAPPWANAGKAGRPS